MNTRSSPRIFCPSALLQGESLELSPEAARHVQVLRLQPGDELRLFNGRWNPGAANPGEFVATIEHMGRREVRVKIERHLALEREARRGVHLAVGMPANERMDWLVEKAAELGVASIQPLMTERSVLRLNRERAQKKLVHWQNVAIAACEQCGGNRVPLIHEVIGFAAWAEAPAARTGARLLLSLRAGVPGIHQALAELDGADAELSLLSGPEGGLTESELATARSLGFVDVTLGPRVLRAETDALAALAAVLV